MDINLSTVIRQDPAPLTAAVDGEVMMMSPERGCYYGLNGLGSRIWELAAQPITVADLCQRLLGEYEVSPEQCRKETCAFLGQLFDRGLIQVCDAPAA